MRFYFDSYGQIYSLNKKDTLEMLYVLYRTGQFNLYDFKSTKAINGEAEYGCFYQGKKIRSISLNLIEVTDQYFDGNDGGFTQERILDLINQIRY